MTWRKHFPGTPREIGQAQVLDQLYSSFKENKLFVVSAPTGVGKSKIAECVANFAEEQGMSTTICIPNNILLQQYHQGIQCLDDWYSMRDAVSLRGVSTQDKKEYMRGVGKKLFNYISTLSYRAYSDVMIFDEAHLLTQWLNEDGGAFLWGHQWHIAPYHNRDTPHFQIIRNMFDFIAWAQHGKHDAKIQKLLKLLSRNPDDYIFGWEEALYRGEVRWKLSIRMLTPRSRPPILWPFARVKKIILMSATINNKDVYDLGLERLRAKYIHGDSPIPTKARPIYYNPLYRRRDGVAVFLDRLEMFIQNERFALRGLLHCTYSVARKIQYAIEQFPERYPTLKCRLLFHKPFDKELVLKFWQSSADRVLVGSGMVEGLDLVGDKCRWQMIINLLYPNLGQDAIKKRVSLDQEWYSWQAIKGFIQGSGRVSRGVDDYGETFILDSTFKALYEQYGYLFPNFIKESISL